MHVPEENLFRYRNLMNIAAQFKRLGGAVSGLGHYETANRLWAMELNYRLLAQELRVPGKDGK